MLHVGYAHYLRSVPWLGVTGGVVYTAINGSPQNGQVEGRYLSGDIGLVARKSLGRSLSLRVEVGPTVGGLRDTHDPNDTQLGIGAQGAAFLGVRF
jgi:hypothetical protein